MSETTYFEEALKQLWLLRQIYKNENSFYDQEKKAHLYRIPSGISDKQLSFLEKTGRLPGQIIYPDHNEIIRELRCLADTWTIQDAANAFVAGLWSAPFLWQCALPAKLLSLVIPLHEHTPYGNSVGTCAVCGFKDGAIDPAYLWSQRMTVGAPLDGEPVGYVMALREMEKMGKPPVPTEYDLWVFRAVLTVIRQMQPKSRYSKVRDVLHREKLLPASSKYKCSSLLEILALTGILDTEAYPGMATEFTTYRKRDERPNVRVEVQAPLAWWDSSVGINEGNLQKLFGWMDCSSVSLTERPKEMPKRQQTLAVALESKLRLRSGKRWQSKVSGIDRTTGLKRIARNIQPPVTELPEPERISFSVAGSLGHLAWWCFGKL